MTAQQTEAERLAISCVQNIRVVTEGNIYASLLMSLSDVQLSATIEAMRVAGTEKEIFSALFALRDHLAAWHKVATRACDRSLAAGAQVDLPAPKVDDLAEDDPFEKDIRGRWWAIRPEQRERYERNQGAFEEQFGDFPSVALARYGVAASPDGRWVSLESPIQRHTLSRFSAGARCQCRAGSDDHERARALRLAQRSGRRWPKT